MSDDKKSIYPDATRGSMSSGLAHKQFQKARGKDKKFHFVRWLIALVVFVLALLWVMGIENLA